MRLSWCAAAFLAAGSAAAQNPFYGYQPLGRVSQFLELTAAQTESILTHNDEYNRWASEKQQRIRQVQSEIVDETARDPLDPAALGVRYAEIEGICREMKDKANELRTRNLDVLNAEQKIRLQILEEALRLAPVINEAQFGNLVGTYSSAPPGFTGRNMGIGGSGMIGAIIGGANGCALPFAHWVDVTTFSAPGTAARGSRR